MDKLRTTIILSLILTVFISVAIVCNQPLADVAAEPIPTEPEATYIVLPLITDAPTSEEETTTAEATDKPSETVAETTSSTESSTELETTLPTKRYYNVNLSTELQDLIFAECERYGIHPSIIIALIERESQFDRYAMGDDGRSFGLMQIQPKWHLQRMIQMGYTDLFDPIENIKVGTAILGDLYAQYNDIGLALTAYNSGSANDGYNGYAMGIMARANEI